MTALPSLLDAVGRRLALRLPHSESIEVERVLAVARALMAVEGVLFTGRLSHWMEPGFNFNTFIMSGAFLAIFGALVGYLAEAEKRGRLQALSIWQVSSKARVEIGLKATLQATLQELLGLFDGRKLLVVVSEGNPAPAYLWRLEGLKMPAAVRFDAHPFVPFENPILLFRP